MNGRGQFFLMLTALFALSAVARANDQPNQFPIQASAEAFIGEPSQIRIEFPFYFPVDFARYRPVDPALAALLSLPPVVLESPEGLGLEVLQTECSPRLMDVSTGGRIARVEGGQMSVGLAVEPRDGLVPGEHSVILQFPQIDYVFEVLGSQPRPASARVQLRLSVWASREAKLEAQQRQAEERRRRRMLAIRRATKGLLVVLAGLTIVAVPYRWFRPWLRPAAKVEVAPGGHVQVSQAVPARRRDRNREAGTILHTLWARDVLGRRKLIKVETLKTGIAETSTSRLDLLVSAGTSVRAGTYGARGPNGAVRVRVHVSRAAA